MLPPGAVVWQAEPGRYAAARLGPDGTHDAPFNRDLKIVDRSPVGGDPETSLWRPGDGIVRPAVRHRSTLIVRRGPTLTENLRLESRVELVCEGYARVHVRHEFRLDPQYHDPLLFGPPVGVYHLVRDAKGTPWRRVRATHPVPAAWALAAVLDPTEAPF
jgi:hypothetical protein